MLGKQGAQLWGVMQVVWPDSDAGRAGFYYPTREVGGDGQDMWAELQEAADPVKMLLFTFLGAREKSTLCTGSSSPGRV